MANLQNPREDLMKRPVQQPKNENPREKPPVQVIIQKKRWIVQWGDIAVAKTLMKPSERDEPLNKPAKTLMKIQN